MTRTSNRPPSIRSPSVESRKEEEEDSSEEEPRPFDQPRQVFRSNGKPIFFAFHGLTAEEEAELTGLIVVSFFIILPAKCSTMVQGTWRSNSRAQKASTHYHMFSGRIRRF